FVMNNKRVGEAVRTLDGLQLQNVIKGDLQKNIKNILENSSNCNQPEIVGMRNQFANVAYTGSSALRKEFHFSDPHQAFDNVFVQCLLTPAKFEPDENSESLGPEQLDIRHFKLEIVKINTVNLSNVFIDLSAIVTLGLKAKNGGFTNYKY